MIETSKHLTPDDPLPWFSNGARAEFGGDIDRACSFYLTALTLTDQFTRCQQDRSLPEALLKLVSHAKGVTQARRRALIEEGLDRIESAYGRHELKRVRRAFNVYLGDAVAEQAPQQKAAFLYFPGIRALPYYDPGEFAWTRDLEESWIAIAREAQKVALQQDGAESFYNQDRSPIKILMPGWQAFFFYRYSHRFDDNHRLCPETSSALDKVSLCHVAGHAPETLFSILTPYGDIKPHRGMTNTRLVAHLPLIVPEPDLCGLDVAGIEHRWHEGKLVVFDDTFLHSAYNNSHKPRTVLLMDIWHPDLTEIERLALSEMIASWMRFGATSHNV